MALPSKTFTSITDVRIQPDAPVDTTLMRDLRDNDINSSERIGIPTGSGTADRNHAHLGLGKDGSAAIGGTTGGISIVSGSYLGTFDNNNPNLTRFKPEFMMIAKVARTGVGGSAGPVIKHSGDDAGESTPLLGSGGKASVGINRLQLGGASFDSGAPFFNTVDDRFTTLLLKSNPSGIKFGTYTGDNAADRGITGIGFQPSIVFVWRATSNVNSIPVIKTIGMTGDNSKDFGGNSGAIITNGIKTLDLDGFTIGNSSRVNSNNIVYAFVALKSFTDSGEAVQVDSYTGNGVNPRTLVNTAGFAPHWAWIINTDIAGSTRTLVLSSIEMRNALSTDDGEINSALVLEMLETGIELTADNHVNASGDAYDIIWFQSGVRP